MSQIKKLKSICSGSASDSEIVLSCYERDSSEIKGKPDAVVWPLDIESIRKLIMFASRSGINLTPRGSGTGISGGSVPTEGVVVDMSKMDKIIQINLRERKAMVEAGVTLSELNKVLEKYSMKFPILPYNADTTQIGSMIATDASGFGSRHFGPMCKNIISVEYIDGAGRIYSTKDPSAVVGMEGTTGIITKAEIRLAKPTRIKSLSIFSSDDINSIIRSAKRYSSFKTVISMDFYDKNTASLFDLDDRYHLFISFSDNTGKYKEETQIKKKQSWLKGFESVFFEKKFPIVDEIRIRIDKLQDLSGILEKNKVPFYGDLGQGIIRLRYMHKKEEELKDKVLRKCSKIGAKACNGSSFGMRKKSYVPNSHKNLLKDNKKKYDPKDIMNRGKVI